MNRLETLTVNLMPLEGVAAKLAPGGTLARVMMGDGTRAGRSPVEFVISKDGALVNTDFVGDARVWQIVTLTFQLARQMARTGDDS